ncbi:MAG: type II secretion system protein [Actinobacteria bacterium]|nr:type II secretion system protein [Actinomycetota bacterium]
MIARRLRALGTDERGFTLLETVIAVTVIFSSLVALAYAATASFTYQDIARQRQAANGIADKVMEEVRGLAYDKVTAGLLDTDLTGDSNIVSCSGVYRFLSCTKGTEPGSGEKIVNHPGLTTTVPLVPHRSSTSPNTSPVLNHITYTWSTYVTQDDSVTNAPYRVTVIVTWTKGAVGGAKLVRIQSLFWSPIGCRSTSTHPFSAPCQPFFLGDATVPNGSVSVTGTIQGISFSTLDILLTGASADVQEEQVASADGAVHPIEGSVTDGGGVRTAGGVTVATDADSDPNTLTGPYARQRCGTEVTCSGGSLTSPSGGGSTKVALTVPTTTSGESDSAITATGSSVCPPSLISSTAESDSLPCSGAAASQPSSVVAVATLSGTDPDVGTANLVSVGTTSNLVKAFVNMVANPAPVGAGCSPAAGTNGCVASSASRVYGNIRLGALPTKMTTPFNTGSCGGYFLTVSAYSDSATAAAGEGTPLPTATAPTGTLYYYDQASSSCKSIAIGSSSLTGLNLSYTSSPQNIDGKDVTVTISTVTAQMTAASTATSATPSTSSSPQPTRTDESAQVVAPTIAVHYVIVAEGNTLMDVTETISLGTLTVDATYAPPPSAG